MIFMVATDVIASWPPEYRPTGIPTARAKMTDIALVEKHLSSSPHPPIQQLE